MKPIVRTLQAFSTNEDSSFWLNTNQCQDHIQGVTCLAFHPTNPTLFSGSMDKASSNELDRFVSNAFSRGSEDFRLDPTAGSQEGASLLPCGGSHLLRAAARRSPFFRMFML